MSRVDVVVVGGGGSLVLQTAGRAELKRDGRTREDTVHGGAQRIARIQVLMLLMWCGV